MSSPPLVQKLWNYCNVLRDDGMSYGDYPSSSLRAGSEQLALTPALSQRERGKLGEMADERSRPPYNQASPVLVGYDWLPSPQPSPGGRGGFACDGDELFDHYRHTLEELGKQKGLLGLIFNKSQNKFQAPAKLRRLILDRSSQGFPS